MSFKLTSTHRGWILCSLSHVIGGYAKSRPAFPSWILTTRYMTLWRPCVRLEEITVSVLLAENALFIFIILTENRWRHDEESWGVVDH